MAAQLAPQLLADGFVFLEGPGWHDGKLWVSDMFAEKVLIVDKGNTELSEAAIETVQVVEWEDLQ